MPLPSDVTTFFLGGIFVLSMLTGTPLRSQRLATPALSQARSGLLCGILISGETAEHPLPQHPHEVHAGPIARMYCISDW